MKNNDNLKSLLEVIRNRKPLIMDLGDNVLLHMRWHENEKAYEDEMGLTSMNLIQDIINEKVFIKGKKVLIKEDYEKWGKMGDY